MWRLLRPDAVAVLSDRKARRSLHRYFDVIEDEKHAKFVIARRLSADFSRGSDVLELWKLHDELTAQYYSLERRLDEGDVKLEEIEVPKLSYFDLKVELARRILQSCHFCVRRCGADRLAGELGFCKCGTRMLVSSVFHHHGEEPELVPSGTIFTMGCTMRCIHCQNWSISQWFELGEPYGAESLAREVEKLRKGGCRNVNLVGGEPTPWTYNWLDAFNHVEINVPIVWNSNSYYSERTAQLLAGFADVYLLDFKYGNDECAERISSAPGYWEACTRNHLRAKKYGELIIRVLVLPEHLECCTLTILDWIAKNLGKWMRVNVMFQYRSEWRAQELPELRRRLTAEERSRAIQIAEEVGLENFIT